MPECNIEAELIKLAEKNAACLIKKLKEHSKNLALAESCTAGLISSLLANIPGASAVLWGSFVCYAKEAKIFMLGLDNNALADHGLVSKETACLMAQAAQHGSGADIAAAVTGLAGPGGDGSGVPAGTVWAAVRNGEIAAREFHFSGSRNEVRIRSAIAVLEMLLERLA